MKSSILNSNNIIDWNISNIVENVKNGLILLTDNKVSQCPYEVENDMFTGTVINTTKTNHSLGNIETQQLKSDYTLYNKTIILSN